MPPPPDAVPEARPAAGPAAAAPSGGTLNAVRGGILAALSSPARPPAPAGAAVPAPPAPPPPRGIKALVRAAGRRGLLAAKPLAAPFLHRLQMRLRTAVDESGLAARSAGIEQALAGLSGRLDGDAAASRREMADIKRLLGEAARRSDAAAAEQASRLDALRREAAAAGAAAADSARRQEAMQRRLDETQQRLDAVLHGVAALPDAVQARATARRPPIPLGGEFLAWTPDGPLLLPAEDLRLLAAMSEGGVLEPGTRRVLAALLRPGGVFLDVGAHAGTMTLPGARRVGEGGRVFAVEPLPRLAALLRRSLALNDVCGRVSVSACAAGEEDGEAALHVGEVLGHSSLLPLPDAPNAEAVRVQVRRVDGLVPAGTRVDLAKIDAEGAELRVWRGMRRVLSESPDLAAVLEFGPSHLARAGAAPEAWLGELEASGFEAFAIDEATGACRPASAPALADVFSVNLLLLRPGAAARHPDLVFA